MANIISFNFNGDFCPELASLSNEYPKEDIITSYCTTDSSRIKMHSTDTYMAEMIANYLGHIDTMHLFVAKTEKGYVAEYAKPGKDTQVVIADKKGDDFTFKAGIISDTGLLTKFDAGHKGTVFAAALFPEIIKEAEAASCVDILNNYNVEEEEYSHAMCGLSVNMYYRLKDAKSSAPVTYSNYADNITQSNIDKVNITRILAGEPKVFKRVVTPMAVPKAAGKTVTAASEMRGKYKLNSERENSSEEERRVPDLQDWYKVPDWVDKTASRIARSQKFRNPINNILLYGTSGTGKTEGAQAIAEMLDLPYYTLTCSPDDDKFDILGQMVPNTKKGGTKLSPEEICNELSIPTFEDVENDFEGVFESLFGRKPAGLDSPADCYSKISEMMMEYAGENENDFVFVESEFISCMKNGGVIELQEANLIKNAAVLDSVNPLLANGGDNSFIKLQNGEIIRRHKDCVVIFTINRDYEGTNNLQEAVYSRLNYVVKIEIPSVTEMVERAKEQTGFNNAALLKKMAEVVHEIHEYSVEKDISGGVCSVRELLDWCYASILESEEADEEKITESSVICAAFPTVLEKAAQNDDDIEDIITAVFKKKFSASKVDELRPN